MRGPLTVEGERDVDDSQVGDVGMWHPHQHLQGVELWILDQVRHGADPAAGNGFVAEKDLPLRCGPPLESALQQLVERDAVGDPVRVVGVGGILGKVRQIEHPAQRDEEIVVPRRDHEVTVGRGEHFVGGDEGSPVPLTLRAFARGEVALHVVRQPPGGRLVEAHLHQGADAALRAVPQGGLDPDGGPHARSQVDHPDSHPRRRTVGVAGHRHDPGLRLEDRVVPGCILLGPL